MDEAERIAAVRRYDILDGQPAPELDQVVELAARMLRAPMAAIYLLENDRLVPKAAYGIAAEVQPRRHAFAPHAVSMEDAYVVLDAGSDPVLRQHPLVAGPPFLRFYAVAPIRSPDGHAVGGISVGDTQPRTDMPPDALASLKALARLVESELERMVLARLAAESASRFRDLAEVSSDWLWEADAEHRIVDVFADRPEVTGLKASSLGRRRWEYEGATPLRGTWADYRAMVEARHEFRDFEYEVVTAAGVRHIFRISGRPRFDASGRFLGYRGTGTDITRRRAEELARAMNQRVFETSLDLIVVIDAEGQYVLVSPSATAILGYDPAALMTRASRDVVHPEDLGRVRREMLATKQDGAPRRFDCRCLHRDGRVVPMSVIGLWSEADQHYFFIARDMTDRIAAEERQRQSQRLEAIGQLTGGIAHDFNNILSVIMLKLEATLEDMPDDSPHRRKLQAALTAGARGADLIARLMTFARRRPLTPLELTVGTLLEDLSDLVRTAISRRIPLSLDLAADLHPVRIDRSGLETAILNLAVNARDAMPDGGTLQISARNRTISAAEVLSQPGWRTGHWVEIAVRDTGVGMPPDVQARAFEPFFTTKGEGKGTGLGLAMVHGFVHQSGGFLTLRSAPGEGTTISIYLPAASTRTQADPVEAAA